MARITGVDLNDGWKLDFALTRIRGIGWALAKKILKEVDIENTKRVADLTSDEIAKLTSHLEKYPTEGELARVVRGNIQRLTAIGAYRGIRHAKNLPVRGQRTKTNARTKRGKRKTVGAFKKEILSKMQAGKASGPEGGKTGGKK